jgi:hypothetical protein
MFYCIDTFHKPIWSGSNKFINLLGLQEYRPCICCTAGSNRDDNTPPFTKNEILALEKSNDLKFNQNYIKYINIYETK